MFVLTEQSRGCESRDRGINGGDPCQHAFRWRGEASVYAAKALDSQSLEDTLYSGGQGCDSHPCPPRIKRGRLAPFPAGGEGRGEGVAGGWQECTAIDEVSLFEANT
jgi:hypothetical protein